MSHETSYFKENQAKLRRETNSFADFLESSDKLEKGQQCWIPYANLVKEYRDYCKNNNTRAQKLTGENFASLCEEEGLIYDDRAGQWVPWESKTIDKLIWNVGYKEGSEPSPAFGSSS